MTEDTPADLIGKAAVKRRACANKDSVDQMVILYEILLELRKANNLMSNCLSSYAKKREAPST